MPDEEGAGKMVATCPSLVAHSAACHCLQAVAPVIIPGARTSALVWRRCEERQRGHHYDSEHRELLINMGSDTNTMAIEGRASKAMKD